MLPLLLLSLALGTSAKDAKEAERLVKQSIVEYNVGDFDAALTDVTKAYKLRSAPALLFNIGQCHRALHHWEKAAFFYHGYLREKPHASNRDKVEALIEEMQQKQRADAPPAVMPPAAPLAVPPLAATTPAPPVAEPTTVPLVMTEPRPPPARAAPAAATEVTIVPSKSESRHPSGWAIGLGSGAIVATVVAGIGAATLIDFQSYRNGLQGPPQSYPGSTYLTKSSQAQAWQVITPIAAGVAAACALGAVLTW